MKEGKSASYESQVQIFRDERQRPFYYLLRPGPLAKDLVIHFSAFVDAWGGVKAYREDFKGYFHRLKLLDNAPDHNWLFLCDQYGVDGKGSYYAGAHGDLFVERAIESIIREVQRKLKIDGDSTVLMGSSMGATAALKFGIKYHAKGVVAIAPHIDLDICAVLQGREREVAHLLPDGDTQAVHNYPYTRQIRHLLSSGAAGSKLPRLFVQCCGDDVGVYPEQVVSLVNDWTRLGGRAHLDIRKRGGHTSDYAGRELLLDVVSRMLSGDEIDVRAYQTERQYRTRRVRPPLRDRLRRMKVHLTSKYLRGTES